MIEFTDEELREMMTEFIIAYEDLLEDPDPEEYFGEDEDEDEDDFGDAPPDDQIFSEDVIPLIDEINEKIGFEIFEESSNHGEHMGIWMVDYDGEYIIDIHPYSDDGISGDCSFSVVNEQRYLEIIGTNERPNLYDVLKYIYEEHKKHKDD